MTRSRAVVFLSVFQVSAAIAGCSASPEAPGLVGAGGGGVDAAAERTPPPMHSEGGVDSGATGRAGDAAPPLPDGNAGGGAPADAYIRSGPGPFGLSGRAPHQTCNAPANYRQPPATLSATGCADPSDPRKPAPSLIPYDVNSALWSDGADKQRFIALPDGAVIHVKDCAREPATCAGKADGGTPDDEGHWQLPVGTVLVKSFLFAGKLVETRLFVRFADRYAGYSYQWDDAQTDATLVSTDGDTKTIVNAAGMPQTWSLPSRGGCLECHTDAAGGSLGLETMQLERTVRYPSGVEADQIATLEHIGVFDGPVPVLPALVDPAVVAGHTLEARARSYLHANCANCHRPDGPFNGLDLRFNVPLAQMSMCNVVPQKGEQGVAGARLMVPTMPEKSTTTLRMQAPDKASGRMPTLATSVVDTAGLALVSDWIKGVAACP